jgi:hypothetical protein
LEEEEQEAKSTVKTAASDPCVIYPKVMAVPAGMA